jgi:hypothetical protein
VGKLSDADKMWKKFRKECVDIEGWYNDEKQYYSASVMDLVCKEISTVDPDGQLDGDGSSALRVLKEGTDQKPVRYSDDAGNGLFEVFGEFKRDCLC